MEMRAKNKIHRKKKQHGIDEEIENEKIETCVPFLDVVCPCVEVWADSCRSFGIDANVGKSLFAREGKKKTFRKICIQPVELV